MDYNALVAIRVLSVLLTVVSCIYTAALAGYAKQRSVLTGPLILLLFTLLYQIFTSVAILSTDNKTLWISTSYLNWVFFVFQRYISLIFHRRYTIIFARGTLKNLFRFIFGVTVFCTTVHLLCFLLWVECFIRVTGPCSYFTTINSVSMGWYATEIIAEVGMPLFVLLALYMNGNTISAELGKSIKAKAICTSIAYILISIIQIIGATDLMNTNPYMFYFYGDIGLVALNTVTALSNIVPLTYGEQGKGSMMPNRSTDSAARNSTHQTKRNSVKQTAEF